MESNIKLLRFFTSASEVIQAAFFFGLVLIASSVAYFQSYDPKETPRSLKDHIFAYMKTFLSGFLAFVLTLFMSAMMGWDFFVTCLIGGVSVLFSKQFFEALYKFVIQRIFGVPSVPEPPKEG